MITEQPPTIRLLLIGFGRMGVTHLSILLGLLDRKPAEVFIVDSSFTSRLLAKELLGSVKVYRKLSDVEAKRPSKYFDFCLITTPPINRSELVLRAGHLAKRTLIEKPLMVQLGDDQMSGYVLQHSPLNDEVFNILNSKSICKINGCLTTNIGFADINKGWRSGKFGTVLYEFGGHLMSLICSTCGNSDMLLKMIDIEDIVVSLNEPDHVKFEFKSVGIDVSIELKAAATNVRKASYELEYVTKDAIYKYDLYSLVFSSNDDPTTKDLLLNIASTNTSVPFYVRGFEFSRQMEAFLDGRLDKLEIDQISNIEKIIEAMV